MKLLNCIFMFIFFISIIWFGYSYSRRILKENKLIYLIPLSVCFGSSFFVILLQLFSLLLSVQKATYICISLTLALALFILFKYKLNNHLELGLSKIQFSLLFLFSLVVGVLFFAYLLNFDTYDPGVYQLIGLMTKQDIYPNSTPHHYGTIHIYHNGVALFASSLKIFSNLEIFNSLYPIQILFIAIFPLILFALIFSITKSFSQAMIASIVGCFCATLKSLNLLLPFDHEIFNKLTNDFRDYLFWMADSGFVSPTQKALVSPNSSIALPLSAFLFLLCLKENLKNNWHYLTILFTSSFLFLSYEAYWFPTVVALCLCEIVKTIQSKWTKKQIISSITLILILGASPTLAGGVFQNKNENITKLVSLDIKPYTLSFGGTLQFVYPPAWFKKEKNIYVSPANGNTFYKLPILSKYLFHEFGLPLVTLPLILLYLLKSKNQKLLSLLLSGLVSFAIPFLITYNLIEIETHRFLIYSRFVFSVLFGAFIGSLFDFRPPVFLLNIFYKTFLFLLIIVLVAPGIYWLMPIKHKYEYRATTLTKADKKTLSWLSKHSRSGDVGIGPWDIPFRCFELISLAGVYGSGVHIQNIAEEETRTTALSTLNPCLLKELHVKWLYLNKNLDSHKHALIPQDILDLITLLPKDTLKQLLKEKILVQRFKYKDKSELRLIYEFNPRLAKNYCKNKDYIWSIGRLQQGKFIPIKSSFQTTFQSKKSALKKLKELKKLLTSKEALWYGVEAIVNQ